MGDRPRPGSARADGSSGLGEFEHRFHLAAERPRVFALFADPHQLDRLTPRWFRLRPLAGPERLGPGATIRYRLRWRGLPLAWTSVITDWREPSFLAYDQRRGPYRSFRHEHYFEPSLGGGTEVRDRVLFRAPGGPLVERLLVRPDLARIFAHRERRARELLGE